jgi:MFS family permease
MATVPLIADSYGRKWPMVVTIIIFIIGAIGLLVTDNLYEAYFHMFLIGFTFAGRVVVGLNYTMEYLNVKFHTATVATFLQSMAIGLILITAWYQFIDRGYFLLQLIVVMFAIASLIYFWALVPESPKWLYAYGRYQESRSIMRYVASANSKPEESLKRFDTLKFDIEVLDEMMDGGSQAAKTSKSNRL